MSFPQTGTTPNVSSRLANGGVNKTRFRPTAPSKPRPEGLIAGKLQDANLDGIHSKASSPLKGGLSYARTPVYFSLDPSQYNPLSLPSSPGDKSHDTSAQPRQVLVNAANRLFSQGIDSDARDHPFGGLGTQGLHSPGRMGLDRGQRSRNRHTDMLGVLPSREAPIVERWQPREISQGFNPSGVLDTSTFDWDKLDNIPVIEGCANQEDPGSDIQQSRHEDTMHDMRQPQEMPQDVVSCDGPNEPEFDWCSWLLKHDVDHTSKGLSVQGKQQHPSYGGPSNGFLCRPPVLAPSCAYNPAQEPNTSPDEVISINVTQRAFDTFPGCKSKGGICVISCSLETGSKEGSTREPGTAKFSADFCGGWGFGISEATAKQFEPIAEAVVSVFKSHARANQAAYTKGAEDLTDQRYQDPTHASWKVSKELATLFQDRYETCNDNVNEESQIPVPPEGMIFLATLPTTAEFYINRASQKGDRKMTKPAGRALWPTLKGRARDYYLSNIQSRSRNTSARPHPES